MADRYAWKFAKNNVGKSGNIPGEITQWSRSTVADGKWMNNEQLLPLSGRDQYLLDSINDVYNTLSTNGIVDALNAEITRAKLAENNLQSIIDSETTRASAEENALKLSIDSFDKKIQDETNRATTEETKINTNVDILYEDCTSLNNSVNELNNKIQNTIELSFGNGIDFNNNNISFKYQDSSNIFGEFDENGNIIFDLASTISAENIITNSIVTNNNISDITIANTASFNNLTIDDSTIPEFPTTPGSYNLLLTIDNSGKPSFKWVQFLSN